MNRLDHSHGKYGATFYSPVIRWQKNSMLMLSSDDCARLMINEQEFFSSWSHVNFPLMTQARKLGRGYHNQSTPSGR
jgi:hypothetical protein